MPVRQLSQPSVSASASSSSETTTSTAPVLATAGELASGAVGSSTTISISVLDMDGVSCWQLQVGDTALISPASMTRGPVGECTRKCGTFGPEQPAFGDQSAHQPCRRHVESVIGDRRTVGYQAHRFDPSVGGASRDRCDLVGRTLLDRNL